MTVRNVGAGQTYTTVAAAISDSAQGDEFVLFGNATFDEVFPSNITWADLTFSADNTDVDDKPTLRLSGGNWDSYWDNQTGYRKFVGINLGNFQYNGNGSSGIDRALVIEDCFVSGNSVELIQLNDTAQANRITITNTIFVNNTGIIFKKPANQNNNISIGGCFNCCFYGNTTVTDNAIAIGRNEFINMTNCVFKGNTTTCADSDVKDNWDYNYAGSGASWGTGGISSAVDPFANSSGSNPTDFKIKDNTILAIDAGTTTGAPTNDIEGTVWPNPIDMGAFVFVTATLLSGGKRLARRLGLSL